MPIDTTQRGIPLPDFLRSFKRTLERYFDVDTGTTSDEFFEIMEEFWKELPKYRAADRSALYFNREENYTSLIDFFTRAERAYVFGYEYRRATEILAEQGLYAGRLLEALQSDYDRQMKALIQSDIRLLGIPHPERIVVVASGPLSQTGLSIARYLPSAQVTCIDSSEQAVNRVESLIRAFPTPIEVKVIHENGVNYDYGPHDAVIVANSCIGKGEVVEQVAKTVETGARIIVRVPSGASFMYEPLNSHPEGIHYTGQNKESKPLLIRSTLFVKN